MLPDNDRSTSVGSFLSLHIRAPRLIPENLVQDATRWTMVRRCRTLSSAAPTTHGRCALFMPAAVGGARTPLSTSPLQEGRRAAVSSTYHQRAPGRDAVNPKHLNATDGLVPDSNLRRSPHGNCGFNSSTVYWTRVATLCGTLHLHRAARRLAHGSPRCSNVHANSVCCRPATPPRRAYHPQPPLPPAQPGIVALTGGIALALTRKTPIAARWTGCHCAGFCCSYLGMRTHYHDIDHFPTRVGRCGRKRERVGRTGWRRTAGEPARADSVQQWCWIAAVVAATDRGGRAGRQTRRRSVTVSATATTRLALGPYLPTDLATHLLPGGFPTGPLYPNLTHYHRTSGQLLWWRGCGRDVVAMLNA